MRKKIILNNFISSATDPYQNNLTTGNATIIDELEILLYNDLQYLRFQNTKFNQNKYVLSFPNFNQKINTIPSKPINVIEHPHNPYKTYAPKMQIKNEQNDKPTPTQTTQPTQTPQCAIKYSRIDNYATLK